jgi:hypothetical protein
MFSVSHSPYRPFNNSGSLYCFLLYLSIFYISCQKYFVSLDNRIFTFILRVTILNSASLLYLFNCMTSHMFCSAYCRPHCAARPYVVLYGVLYSLVITPHFKLCCHFLDGFLYLIPGTSQFFIHAHHSIFTLKCSVWFQVVIYCMMSLWRVVPIALCSFVSGTVRVPCIPFLFCTIYWLWLPSCNVCDIRHTEFIFVCLVLQFLQENIFKEKSYVNIICAPCLILYNNQHCSSCNI